MEGVRGGGEEVLTIDHGFSLLSHGTSKQDEGERVS